jgi:hypothetical protein
MPTGPERKLEVRPLTFMRDKALEDFEPCRIAVTVTYSLS